jgi:exosortase family protein XrtM
VPNLSYPEMLKAEAKAAAGRRSPLRVALIFFLIFIVLSLAWDASAGTGLERLIIHDLTVRPAAWLIGLIWPEQAVTAQGHVILSPAGRLNVLIGCDGLETLFLLVAAFVAYPFSWRMRLTGIALGTGVVFCINQARIVCLWQAWIFERDWFAPLHGLLLPAAMIACCLAFFLLFLARHEPV